MERVQGRQLNDVTNYGFVLMLEPWLALWLLKKGAYLANLSGY
jgi:hypothetical protein